MRGLRPVRLSFSMRTRPLANRPYHLPWSEEEAACKPHRSGRTVTECSCTAAMPRTLHRARSVKHRTRVAFHCIVSPVQWLQHGWGSSNRLTVSYRIPEGS